MLQHPVSRGFRCINRHKTFVLPAICLLIFGLYICMHMRHLMIDIEDDSPSFSELRYLDDSQMTAAVKEMTRFAWRNYVKYCARPYTGNDLDPIKRACSPVPDVLLGPRQLVTAVDALDTFAIMEMHEEFEEARQMVTGGKRAALSNVTVSVFETCIRLLGGYLGAYSFTQDSRLLAEAVAVADRLAESFSDTRSLNRNDLVLLKKNSPRPNSTVDFETKLLAATGTLYLEFVYLSHITGDKKYEQWVTRNHELLMKAPNVQGLYPMEMTPEGMPLTPDPVYSAGGGGDSFYEYLVKKCLYSKNPDPKCTRDYTAALDSIMKCMTVQVSPVSDLLCNPDPKCTRDYTAALDSIMKCMTVQVSPVSDLLCVVNVKKPCNAKQQLNATCTMEHLTCFLGGTYALAYMMNPHRTDWLRFAERITHTCYLSYFHSPNRLGSGDFQVQCHVEKVRSRSGQGLLHIETGDYRVHLLPALRHWAQKVPILGKENPACHQRQHENSNRLQRCPQNPVEQNDLDNTQQSFSWPRRSSTCTCCFSQIVDYHWTSGC
ncbi:hypothetical protein BOX15_Mlig016700g1 [Macrostomum lignano]|uniref:alpha-1,2-Mannosidase n=1 Tax=Macrostomum lignano TaxID=282301 RepID=A0A267H2N2_9PLAT|nr:hypothetical protein BOX15_Mlig016700g1 [Macrostomum lignano]